MFRGFISFCVFTLGVGFSTNSYAKADKWMKASATIVQVQGLSVADGQSCEKLEVEWGSQFVQVKVRCGSYYFSSIYPFNGASGRVRVSQHNGTLLITRFDYYGHKVQTQATAFHSLRIPFVSEVIRVERFNNQKLSFYRETFVADDLGRIVSESSLQGIALERAPTQKSAVTLKTKKVRRRRPTKTFQRRQKSVDISGSSGPQS